MIKNKVIEILEKEVGTDALPFISGTVDNPGTGECKISEGRGSVYGIAIKITSKEEKIALFNCKDAEIKGIDNWKSIGDDYYPLYWGKDINMGARLHSHTKASKSTGTCQLNTRKELEKKDIIYGAMPCSNYKKLRIDYIKNILVFKKPEKVQTKRNCQ